MTNSTLLEGRHAIVTGGAQGLGAAMAHALAKAGAAVVIADINADGGKTTTQEIRDAGGTAEYVELDVTNESQWEAAVAQTISSIGGFDILVNNAGIELTGLVIDINPDDVRRMCDINIVGTALGCKRAFRAMKPGGAAGNGGAVVNIASVASLIAFPTIAGYSSTKSAVDRFTRVAAVESGKLGLGVRVNCVAPGLVPTAMGAKLAQDIVDLGLAPDVPGAIQGVCEQTPLARLGTPDEMADAVVFLCSDAARFITGVSLPVDGGMGT
jgi:NAD(P)-dependent dehydrogenase (short-subunit alcohol dehydrogenase family)